MGERSATSETAYTGLNEPNVAIAEKTPYTPLKLKKNKFENFLKQLGDSPKVKLVFHITID